MSDADAVALFRPARAEALRPLLDLDEDAEESDGICAEELEDGSFLLYTFQPFAIFSEQGSEARRWLTQLGASLDDLHDDPRGVLFFPDTIEPEATTYHGVVAEVEPRGVWITDAAPAASSFDIAQMFQGVHEQLVASLGLALGESEEDPEPPPSSK